jgi:hypothetical protein
MSDFSEKIKKLVGDFLSCCAFKTLHDFLMSLSHHIAYYCFESKPETEVSIINILEPKEDNGLILVVSTCQESVVIEAYDDSKNPIKDTNHPNPVYIKNPLRYKWMLQNCTRVLKIPMRLIDINGRTFYTFI